MSDTTPNNPLNINSNVHNNVIVTNSKRENKPIAFPSGMILIWNKESDIPKGWTKCDGGVHVRYK